VPKLSQIPIEVSEWASLRQAVEWVAFNWLPLPEYLEIINPKTNPTLDSNLFSWEQSLAVDRAKRSLFHAFVTADLVVVGKEGYGTFVEEEDGQIEHRSYAANYHRIDSHVWKLAPKIIWHQSRCSCRISRSAAMSWSEMIIKTSKLVNLFTPNDLSRYSDHTVAILKRMTSNGPTDLICEHNSSETYVGAENRASDVRRVAAESVATSMLGGATTDPPSSQTNNIDPNNLSVSSAGTNRESAAEDYACLLEHFMSHVDADDLPRRADLARREKAIETGATAEIDYDLARPQRGDRLRVPATEAEIGPFGHCGELGIGIAHLPRLAVGIHSRTATRRCRRTATLRAVRCLRDPAVTRPYHFLEIVLVHIPSPRLRGPDQRAQQPVVVVTGSGWLIASGCSR